LGAIDLLVGDERNRRGQALNVGSNAVDLISQLIAAAIELRREGTMLGGDARAIQPATGFGVPAL